MKVLFLDFDGVLNSHKWYLLRDKKEPDYPSDEWHAHHIDPVAVDLLNQIIEKTGAKVVVSSTWRIGTLVAELLCYLKLKGYEYGLLDKTPVLPYDRGMEIEQWLEWHDDVEAFVILDDDSDMKPHMDRLVQTHMMEGLTQEHVDRAVYLLNGEKA